MKKKGSIQDLIFIGVSLLIISMVFLIGYKVSNTLNTNFQAGDDFTQDGKDAFGNINNMFPTVIDNMFLILTVGLSLVSLVLASLVRIHPVFLVFFVMILALIIFMSAIFSNVYITIANDSNFVTEAEALTFTTHIMAALPWIIGVVGTILSIVMYKNWSEAN